MEVIAEQIQCMDRGFVLDGCLVRRPFAWKDHRVEVRVDPDDQMQEAWVYVG